MRHIRRATIVLAILITAGCADTVDYVDDNAQTVSAPIFGGAAGVVAGEAIGSGTAQAGLGAAGVIVGLALGPWLQKRDVVYFDRAIDRAAVAEPGEPVHWVNPNTGTTGTMVRMPDERASVVRTCRNLRSKVSASGQIAVEELVVCRPEYGTWYIDSAWPVG